jgi:hypothetical protein
MVMGFHPWPFYDQKQLVDSWASLTDYEDLFSKLVMVVMTNRYGRGFYDQKFSHGQPGLST